MNKNAFTMIEIIFVIVILGILSSIAIPKLSATRDDAKLAAEMTNFKTCVDDLTNEYNTKGEINATVTPGGILTDGPASCLAMKCLVIDIWNDGHLGDFMVKKMPSAEPYCKTFLVQTFPDTYSYVVLREYTIEKLKFF